MPDGKVIDTSDFGLVQRRTRREDQAWWRQVTDEEFREELAEMNGHELESLLSEINAVRAQVGLTANNGEISAEKRARARNALGHIGQKRGILAAEVRRRQTQMYERQGAERDALVAKARDLVAENNLAGAIMTLLDWVDTFGKEGRKRIREEQSARGTPSEGEP